MAAFQGGAIAIGMALLFSGARGEGRRHGGLMLGASAGLLIGVSDVAIKALAEVVPGSPAGDPQPVDAGRGDRRSGGLLRTGPLAAAR